MGVALDGQSHVVWSQTQEAMITNKSPSRKQDRRVQSCLISGLPILAFTLPSWILFWAVVMSQRDAMSWQHAAISESFSRLSWHMPSRHCNAPPQKSFLGCCQIAAHVLLSQGSSLGWSLQRSCCLGTVLWVNIVLRKQAAVLWLCGLQQASKWWAC